MEMENQEESSEVARGRHGENPTSFHGWLLDRSLTDLPDLRTEAKTTRSAKLWGWFGPWVGLGTLIFGGFAIYSGIQLLVPGLPAGRGSKLILIVGGGFVVAGIATLLASWRFSRLIARRTERV